MRKIIAKLTLKMLKILATILTMTTLNANDFSDFSDGNVENLLNIQSVTQAQTKDLTPKSISQSNITKQQLSLLKQANTQRNGLYVMLTLDMMPLDRMINTTDVVRGLPFGAGVRTGIISYLEKNIGIRGYFSLDFTNDKLSPIDRQRENHSGTSLMLALGIDILIDFFVDKNYKNTLGFFMGIGAGGILYFDLEKPIINASGATRNLLVDGNIMVQGGISATILHKHRIEIGARFLPTQFLLIEQDGLTADYNFYVGYSYKL